MSRARRIRTFLYGDQRIEAAELDLLHTPILQRLYDLHQLGLTDRVFIDASHSRLHHTIGVLEQADKLVGAIVKNLEAHATRVLRFRSADDTITEWKAEDAARYVRSRRLAVRLMALLHDLPHAPYGHTLEDEIQIVQQKHDDPERQSEMFYILLCHYLVWLALDDGKLPAECADLAVASPRNGDPRAQIARMLSCPELCRPPHTAAFIAFMVDLGAELLRGQSSSRRMMRCPGPAELTGFLSDLGFAMRALLHLDALHAGKLEECRAISIMQCDFDAIISGLVAKGQGGPASDSPTFHLQRDAFLLDIIGNTICADLLDYARRDTHLAGLRLDYDTDRIAENFTLAWYHFPAATEHGPFLRTAISMFSHKFRIDIPGELMNLLQIRFYVNERMIFHSTKCVAGAMLGSALQLIGWRRIPPHLALVGDAVFLYEVREAVRLLLGLLGRVPREANDRLSGAPRKAVSAALRAVEEAGISRTARSILASRRGQEISAVLGDLKAAIGILARLCSRRYYRPVFRLLPHASVDHLNLEQEQIADTFTDASTRFCAERQIEEAAGLPRGAVVIHCPKGKGPQKIANMLILYEEDGEEKTCKLCEIAKAGRKIFDQHERAVQAVQDMYRSMWRLVVSVAPPHHAEYRRISSVVGHVLDTVLSKGDSSGKDVPNDATLLKELDLAAVQPVPAQEGGVSITRPDGSSERWTAEQLDFVELVMERLGERSPRVAELGDTQDGQALDIRQLVDELLPAKQATLVQKHLYDRLWPVAELYTTNMTRQNQTNVRKELRHVSRVAAGRTQTWRDALLRDFESRRLSLPAGATLVFNRDAAALVDSIRGILRTHGG